MRAELAADLAARDPKAAEQTLQQLTGEVRTALAEIRRLVDGLRPPSLDERGLVGAIQAQAERLGPQPAFNIAATAPLPDLPAAVEVAAYRIAVEAMTNAARHAGAHECRVALAMTDGEPPSLSVEITDDGAGLPVEIKPGIGLASMRERAAEVGGSIDFIRLDGGGTTVTARLPLTRASAP
jgi:signal transduction histidine kinase